MMKAWYFFKDEAEDALEMLKHNGYKGKIKKETIYIIESDAPQWAFNAGGIFSKPRRK